MVTKSKKQATGENEQKKSRVKVGKLKLSKETVKGLTRTETKKVKGGIRPQASAASCSPTCDGPWTCPC